MTRWLCLALLLPWLNASAEIHSYVNANGERVFTDRPPAAASTTTVQPQSVNRMQAGQRLIKLKPPADSLPAAETPATPRYTRLQLLQPAADATLRNTGRSIELQVSSTPALLPGHSYQLWLDGAPFGSASSRPAWTVNEVDRGTHSLQVHLLDAQGRSLLQTDSVQVHVHQTSLAARRRINSCQNDDYGVRPECPLTDKPPEPKKGWWRLGF